MPRSSTSSTYFLPPSSRAPEPGDRELLLNEDEYLVGETVSQATYGDHPETRYQILGGPYDCPPMATVLDLEAWLEDERPVEPWALYTRG